MEYLTKETFIDKIFDYEKSEDWKFKGDKPCLIAFSAEGWCQPCKMLAPVLEDLSQEYSDVNFYKIEIDDQNELASVFQIRSVPTLLFCQMDGDPQMTQGALPKSALKKIIDEELLKK
jgi:thioredoxin